MGRSKPTFIVPECAYIVKKDEYGDTIGFESGSDVDFTVEESIRNATEFFKQRVLNCWSHEGFNLEAEEEDGTKKWYHFLEFSGTRQLAEDIERFRLLVGNHKLSLYGISYGTKVMGTYASIFPDQVNLVRKN